MFLIDLLSKTPTPLAMDIVAAIELGNVWETCGKCSSNSDLFITRLNRGPVFRPRFDRGSVFRLRFDRGPVFYSWVGICTSIVVRFRLWGNFIT